MDVKGRYNSSKKSIYFQEVAGAGGWLRANVDRDRMWGNGSPHSGALKQKSFVYSQRQVLGLNL